MCHCVFCLLACLTSDSSSLRHRAASQNVTAVSREAAVWLASINYDPSLSLTLEFNLQCGSCRVNQRERSLQGCVITRQHSEEAFQIALMHSFHQHTVT